MMKGNSDFITRGIMGRPSQTRHTAHEIVARIANIALSS